MSVFESLSTLNMNEHVEEKEGLSYLTWSYAWDAVKRRYPDASYTIWKDDKGLPYVYDALTGFMVYTTVTIEGVTHEMWLPVMDSKNKAMKAEPYTYETTNYGKKVTKTVQAATMFDINKTIMRCLVKNLAMFGLGLYIYAGEDLPLSEEPVEPSQVAETKKEEITAMSQQDVVAEAQAKARVIAYVNNKKMSKEKIAALCAGYGVKSLQELSLENCNHYINFILSTGKEI